jgi:hypothetical protein
MRSWLNSMLHVPIQQMIRNALHVRWHTISTADLVLKGLNQSFDCQSRCESSARGWVWPRTVRLLYMQTQKKEIRN